MGFQVKSVFLFADSSIFLNDLANFDNDCNLVAKDREVRQSLDEIKPDNRVDSLFCSVPEGIESIIKFVALGQRNSTNDDNPQEVKNT